MQIEIVESAESGCAEWTCDTILFSPTAAAFLVMDDLFVSSAIAWIVEGFFAEVAVEDQFLKKYRCE